MNDPKSSTAATLRDLVVEIEDVAPNETDTSEEVNHE